MGKNELFENVVIVSCLKNNLTFTQYLLLSLLKNKNKLAYDTYIHNVENIQQIEIDLLEREDYIMKRSDLKNYISDYSITEKGLAVLEDVGKLDWIEEWYNLFPKGVRSGGYLIRDGKSSCLKKMGKFLKDNPNITKEEIIRATKNYVQTCKLKNYDYMKLASYFIEKDGISTLAAECENLSSLAGGAYNPEKGLSKDV
jgi:predicted transcriptional regulator